VYDGGASPGFPAFADPVASRATEHASAHHRAAPCEGSDPEGPIRLNIFVMTVPASNVWDTRLLPNPATVKAELSVLPKVL
jgi:hypothetical protein